MRWPIPKARFPEANRALHDLAEEQKQTEARLERLARQQAELAATVAAQQKRWPSCCAGST